MIHYIAYPMIAFTFLCLGALLMWFTTPAGKKFKVSDPLSPDAPEPRDELLEIRAGEWVPCKPRKWVPEGANPVSYAAHKSQEDGKLYHTRRVG